MYFYNSGYHSKTYNPRSLKIQVNRIVRNLKKLRKTVKFDAIAFCGLSGAAIAYPVSVLAGYHLITIRKERNNQHHGHRVEGSESRNIRRYIILDDFIGTGKTVTTIVRAINRVGKGDAPQCVAIVVYDDDQSRWSSTTPYTVLINKKPIPVFTV